jgi:heat shock transcription factor
MASNSEDLGAIGSRRTPPFISSLFSMVSDPRTDALVSWSADGSSFLIHNIPAFASEILPRFFKHDHFSSFTRQLNFCE